jgi:hypothetical protein
MRSVGVILSPTATPLKSQGAAPAIASAGSAKNKAIRGTAENRIFYLGQGHSSAYGFRRHGARTLAGRMTTLGLEALEELAESVIFRRAAVQLIDSNTDAKKSAASFIHSIQALLCGESWNNV